MVKHILVSFRNIKYASDNAVYYEMTLDYVLPFIFDKLYGTLYMS